MCRSMPLQDTEQKQPWNFQIIKRTQDTGGWGKWKQPNKWED